MSILEEAQSVTSGERRRDYDAALPNHERIARLWNAYLACRAKDTGEPISALDVAHMMILLKIARSCKTPTRDNYVDIAGYSRCAAEISGLE
jgi:ABC-type hemin transport system ATPase subunit